MNKEYSSQTRKCRKPCKSNEEIIVRNDKRGTRCRQRCGVKQERGLRYCRKKCGSNQRRKTRKTRKQEKQEKMEEDLVVFKIKHS